MPPKEKIVLERFAVRIGESKQLKPHYVNVESLDTTLCGLDIPPCPDEIPIVGRGSRTGRGKLKAKHKKMCRNCKRIIDQLVATGHVVALTRFVPNDDTPVIDDVDEVWQRVNDYDASLGGQGEGMTDYLAEAHSRKRALSDALNFRTDRLGGMA